MKKEDLSEKEGIQLVLDSYEDIFSDFDPRAHSEKALSDDFLQECKKAAVDKKDGLELKFLMSKRKRDKALELTIKKRLRAHFLRHFNIKKKDIGRIRKIGFMWFFIGVIISIISVYFLHENTGFFLKFLSIMAEPASWFLFWEGLGKIFIEARKEMPDYGFYKKMVHAYIYFADY
ncbi:hypothetical protein A3K73_02500 [Candidatus Pacearchaeota archaeon RBG_13_36_9]|nr:MAG: hypothetical protein A3K73_02500 [Candidatus Pacearchaeota archaeon RBG_13_36_9]